MTRRSMSVTYLSWAAFEAADPRRAASSERDLGLRWRSAGAGEATHRVAWVRDTGELIAVRHGPAPQGGRVTVLARLSAEDLDAGLDGWEGMCGRPGSYEWLVARVAPAVRMVRTGSGPAVAPARALPVAG